MISPYVQTAQVMVQDSRRFTHINHVMADLLDALEAMAVVRTGTERGF